MILAQSFDDRQSIDLRQQPIQRDYIVVARRGTLEAREPGTLAIDAEPVPGEPRDDLLGGLRLILDHEYSSHEALRTSRSGSIQRGPAESGNAFPHGLGGSFKHRAQSLDVYEHDRGSIERQ